MAAIICYAPQAKRERLSYFALSGEVSLIQTDHVSSEEPAYSTRAGSAKPALPLTKLVSRYYLLFPPSLRDFSYKIALIN